MFLLDFVYAIPCVKFDIIKGSLKVTVAQTVVNESLMSYNKEWSSEFIRAETSRREGSPWTVATKVGDIFKGSLKMV